MEEVRFDIPAAKRRIESGDTAQAQVAPETSI
jgi:hypothetical protein